MKSSEYGRSMIEMLGVLAIVGVLSVGGISGYSKAMTKVKNDRLFNQISELTMNIRSLYMAQNSFKGINTQLIIDAHIVPHEMLTDNPDEINHVYNNKVIIFESKNALDLPQAFEIYLIGLDKHACTSLAIQDWGRDPSTGFESLYVGTLDSNATLSAPLMVDIYAPTDSRPSDGIYTSGVHENSVPLTPSQALASCACGNNECIVGFKYL